MFAAIDKKTGRFTGAVYDRLNEDVLRWGDEVGAIFARIDDSSVVWGEEDGIDDEIARVILPKKAPDAIYLEALKDAKIRSLSLAKRQARGKGLKVGRYTYFAQPEEVMKYKHALELGKRMAQKSGVDWKSFRGEVKVKEGIVTVDGATFDAAIEALDLFLYETWYKEQSLIAAASAAKSKEELEQVRWVE